VHKSKRNFFTDHFQILPVKPFAVKDFKGMAMKPLLVLCFKESVKLPAPNIKHHTFIKPLPHADLQ